MQKEIWIFWIKQIRSCIFAGSFLTLLITSEYVTPLWIPQYDFLFIWSIVIQIILILTKIESREECKYIFIFHIIGFILESFKTLPTIASWVYPETAFFKIWGVPLYSWFMYSAVWSYIVQIWDQLKIKIKNYPSKLRIIILAITIYWNFFTHHFIPDLRYFIIIIIIIVFFKSKILYTIKQKERKTPLTLVFLMLWFFIWIAENIFTFFGARQYPNQETHREIVSWQKIIGWTLLFMISFFIIAWFKKKQTQYDTAKKIIKQ